MPLLAYFFSFLLPIEKKLTKMLKKEKMTTLKMYASKKDTYKFRTIQNFNFSRSSEFKRMTLTPIWVRGGVVCVCGEGGEGGNFTPVCFLLITQKR